METTLQSPDILESLYHRSLIEPNQIAFVEDDCELSFGELWEQVVACADKLENAGIGKGHVVPLFFSNSAELAIALLAVLVRKAVPFVVNKVQEPTIDFSTLNAFGYLRGKKQESSFVKQVQGKVHFDKDPSLEFEFTNNPEYIEGQDIKNAFLLITSSGSSARTKVIRLTKEGVMKNIRANVLSLGIRTEDTTILTLPISYSYGLIGQFLSHLFVGARQVFTDIRFFPFQAGKLITRYQVNSFFTVPPLLRQLLHFYERSPEKHSFDSLRYITVGGNHVESLSIQKAVKLFDCQVIKTYGLAEAGPRVASAKVNHSDEVSACQAFELLKGVEAQILDEQGEALPQGTIGRIKILSPSITSGYILKQAENIEPEKSILTEDFGYINLQGQLVVLGRKNQRIRLESRIVWQNEVADAIYSSGGVLKLSIEEPNEKEICLISVIPNSRTVKAEDLMDLLAEKMGEEVRKTFSIRLSKVNEIRVMK